MSDQPLSDYAELLAECERHRRANLLRSVLEGYDRRDEFVTEAISADNFDRVPWLITEKTLAERDGWRFVADVLADELRRWGWGDFHYGDQGQEQSVLDALAVYEQATDSGGPLPGGEP